MDSTKQCLHRHFDMASIIVINHDNVPQVLDTIVANLQIHEVISGIEFDERLAGFPSYPEAVTLSGKRILVVRSLQDEFNRDAVDLVLLYHLGLIYVEKSKYGPPGYSLPLEGLRLFRLIRGNK